MTEKRTGSFAARAKDAQWGKDLRPYFAYRDLGIKEATEGRVLAHVIRPNNPAAAPWATTPTTWIPDGLPDPGVGSALL